MATTIRFFATSSDGDNNSLRNVKFRVTGWQRRFSSQRQAMATTILFATSSTASLDGNDDPLRNVKYRGVNKQSSVTGWQRRFVSSQRQSDGDDNSLRNVKHLVTGWQRRSFRNVKYRGVNKQSSVTGWQRRFVSSQRQAPRHWMATTILFATSSTAASTNNRASLDGNDDLFLCNVKAMAMTILFATSSTASLDCNDDPLRNVKNCGVNTQSSVTGWQRRFVSLRR
ncbi:hypothetical protein MHU86_4495 [Fragilaria crotonensis]|nr:hypothetical protein MHU86_4495 [Fragilaria crotonensis]